MDAQLLNLQNAFRLASVFSKYVDINSVPQEADAIDFISDIVNKISPEEYLHCVILMTKTDEKTIKQEISLNVLSVFIEGCKLNKVIPLLHFWKSLGL